MPELYFQETAIPRYPDIEQISFLFLLQEAQEKSNFLSLQRSLIICEVLYLINLCKNLLSVVKAEHGHLLQYL